MARQKDSFEEMSGFALGFSRSMDRMLSSLLLQEVGQPPSLWRPPTDVYENENSVVILIEIAGMDPDRIQVEFNEKILRVSGSRRAVVRHAVAHCLEVQYGDFVSEVFMPGHYDLEAIEAEYIDGFLTITLPRVQPEARVIHVQLLES